MNVDEITITAATNKERQEIVDQIIACTADSGVQLLRTTDAHHSRAMEAVEAITLVLQGAAAVGTGVIANTIYDKIRAASLAPERVRKQSTKTVIEIIDEHSGVHIRIKIHNSVERNIEKL